MKRVAFFFLTLALVAFVVEAAAWIGLQALGPTDLGTEAADQVLAAEAAGGGDDGGVAIGPADRVRPHVAEELHPYLGFVTTRPGQDPRDLGWGQEVILPKRDGRTVVAITGGSVAVQLFQHGRDVLVEELKKTPRFREREVVVLRLALGGYKQPQQLMTLNYLLTLGAHFDVVLNLDGFNEVALHSFENGPKQVFPIYPRWWHRRVDDLPNPTMNRYVGELAYLRRELRAVQQEEESGIGALHTARLWKAYRVRRLHDDIAGVIARISSPESGKAVRYVATGARWRFEQDELYRHLAAIWSRASLQMHHLAAANGIEYHHFLQPNQYVAGTRPRPVAGEREIALRDDAPWRRGVEAGYADLMREGEELRRLGVRYTDLTGLFVDDPEPVYSDPCCHFEPRAVRVMAREIAAAIAAEDGPRPGG